MQTATTKRIPYIDAMRGLAMLMVVMGHVALFSFDHTSDNVFIFLCDMVQVPLFFLVSGMCFRLPREWSAKGLWQFLSSKAFILCVPASLFLGAFRYPDFDINMVTGAYKSGYWFTYTLFTFMLFYTFFQGLAILCRLKGKRRDVFHVLATVGVYVVSAYAANRFQGAVWAGVIGLEQFMHYVYFVLGTLAVKYLRGEYPPFGKQKVNWLMGGVIIIVLLMYLYTRKGNGAGYLFSGALWFLILRMFSVAVILSAFHRYASWSEGKLGRVLQHVGRYTLDVYFIHYFLLPRQLTFVGDFFKAHPAPIVECCVTLLITAAIIAVSLLVGKLIRVSPVTAHWLLGAKYPKREEAQQEARAPQQ